MLKETAVKILANLLEKVGGFENAEDFIKDILILFAIEKGLSLRSAIYKYADSGASEQTSEFQLHIAKSKIELLSSFKNLEIDEVMTEKPPWL